MTTRPMSPSGAGQQAALSVLGAGAAVDPATGRGVLGVGAAVDPATGASTGPAVDALVPEVQERVVLCSADGSALGTAPKATVHHDDTPLHLAFSCYLFDLSGRVLVTRRAYGKRTFPGVRTNSCCGHPAPGEGMRIAVLRRLQQELGIVPLRLDLILPAFRYRATASDGTVENELCPVYRAVTDLTATDVQVTAHPCEVHAAWWVPWGDLADPDDGADPLSSWGLEQVRQLNALGPDPFAWGTGRPELLPAAATP